MKIFNTFFMGGYECADHINRSGERINLLTETQHNVRVVEDYEALSAIGIRTVREGICWSAVETSPGVFDFSEVYNRMQAADEFGIQQIWDLVHFGYPDGIYPTHPNFCDRFTALCYAFATFYDENSLQELYVVPINQISSLSSLSGDVRGTGNSDWDIKYNLCKAAILGIQALKVVDPDCVIILAEPLIKIHETELDSPDYIHDINDHQFQAMDIIAGRMCPELGGSEDYLDILGFNYYWNYQWQANAAPLEWPEVYPLRTPLSDLLQMAYERYDRPIFLSETGHFGSERAQWIEEITAECVIAKERGVDLNGICIYAVTDRPDWDDLSSYSTCGIWDLDADKNRIPNPTYIAAIEKAQTQFKNTPKILDFVLNFFKN